MSVWHFGILFIVIALAASDCPSNWHHLGNQCFFISHDTETWINAGTTCRIYNAHIAEITSEAENKFITKLISNENHDFWIGAADILNEGEWVWYNTRKIIDNSSYSNWAAGGLDNANDNENCAQISPNGEWHDAQCDQSNYFICNRSTDHSGEVFG